MWVFLVTELLFSAAFVSHRTRSIAAGIRPTRRREPQLICGPARSTPSADHSSLTMALAVHAAEVRTSPRAAAAARRDHGARIVFLGVKAFEYRSRVISRITFPAPGFEFDAEHALHAQIFSRSTSS